MYGKGHCLPVLFNLLGKLKLEVFFNHHTQYRQKRETDFLLPCQKEWGEGQN